MNDDIISVLRQHYAIAGTEPTHPVRRAIEEIERLRADSAELAAVCAALGGDAFWMDPPDGGNVSIAQQVARANEAGRAWHAAASEPVAWRVRRSGDEMYELFLSKATAESRGRCFVPTRYPEPLYTQSGPSGHSRDLPVTPADGQGYGHLAGDKPALQSEQTGGQPAQADQGVSRTLAGGDRRDERDQDNGCADGRTGGEAACAAGTRPAVDQHRRDGLAEGAHGPDAGGGAADFLLTEEGLRVMRGVAREAHEAERTVWWILLCRMVEREVLKRAAGASRWIACSDKLPEPDVVVLAFFPKAIDSCRVQVVRRTWVPGQWASAVFAGTWHVPPTHWMNLPEAP